MPWITAAEGVHSVDAGGDTWYGIARRFHPREAPWPPTRARALEILHTEYWNACHCDELPFALGVALFDGATNQGPLFATQALQMSLHVEPDGVVGIDTVTAARGALVPEVLAVYLGRRAHAYGQRSREQDKRGLMTRLFRLQAFLMAGAA